MLAFWGGQGPGLSAGGVAIGRYGFESNGGNVQKIVMCINHDLIIESSQFERFV